MVSISGSSATVTDDGTTVTLTLASVGPQGATGPGVPDGGTARQALLKIDGTNQNTAWDTVTSADIDGLDSALAGKATTLTRPRSGAAEFTSPTFSAVAAFAFANGEARAQSLYLPAGTVTSLAVNVTVVGGTGSVTRLGLYADAGGYPGALVVDGGTVDSAVGTGIKSVTVSTAITGGTYWAVAVNQGAATPTATLTYSTTRPGVQSVLGNNSLFTTNANHSRSATGITGALPGPANWTTLNTNPPLVVVGMTAT